MALLTLLSPWVSPAAAWFIFCNAVVGAIAVMSTTTSGGDGDTPSPPRRSRLCRSGSSSIVLDRLRSFFVFPAAAGHVQIDESGAASGSHCYHCCSREAHVAAVVAATQVGAPERSTQAVAAATAGGTAAIGDARPSAPVAMATVEDHSPPAPPPEEEDEKAEAEEEQDDDESISLDEAYALAQRQRHRAEPLASPPPPAAESAASVTAAPAALPTPQHKEKPAAKVAAAPADWRRVSKAGEALVEGKAELNARAELFIRQFREDLRLQRLNSILKHTHALGSPTAAR